MSRSITLVALTASVALLGTSAAADSTPPEPVHPGADAGLDPADELAALLAAASFQDVAVAERAGYRSTADGLGCFESSEHGGMGLHYLDDSLLDVELDVAAPEALVYELDSAGAVDALVAHEYIVPIEAWTSEDAPTLFGQPLHRHPTLPLWVLHVWLWKPNPAGVFADWNPTVRPCPAGVAIFGSDAS